MERDLYWLPILSMNIGVVQGMAVHAYTSNTWEAEEGGPGVQGHSQIHEFEAMRLSSSLSAHKVLSQWFSAFLIV